jgi:hypothetical protein
MPDTSIRHTNRADGEYVDQKFVDLGDGSYGAAISIKDEPAPYSVTITASGSIKSTPGRLLSVQIDSFSANATLKLHNGSSASDAALLSTTARVITATGMLYDFGDTGIAFDQLYAVIAVAACTAIIRVR